MIQTNLTSSPMLTLICGSSSTMNRGGNFLESDKRIVLLYFFQTHINRRSICLKKGVCIDGQKTFDNAIV